MQIKTTLAVSIALLMSAPTLAESTFRQHDAHIHGHVEFNIAQDAHELLIEITAPGADVVGFEHAPQTEQQKEKIANAVKVLNDVNNIFALNAAAKCEIEFKSVTHTLGGDDHENHDHDKHEDHDDHKHHDHDKHEGHDDHKHHDHDKHEGHDDHKHHDHDKHEDHDDHKHHDHDKHEDHDHSGGHGEFTIEYHFHCDNIDKLQSISTEWFTQFETTESVSVNLLTDKAQSATKLSPGSSTISF